MHARVQRCLHFHLVPRIINNENTKDAAAIQYPAMYLGRNASVVLGTIHNHVQSTVRVQDRNNLVGVTVECRSRARPLLYQLPTSGVAGAAGRGVQGGEAGATGHVLAVEGCFWGGVGAVLPQAHGVHIIHQKQTKPTGSHMHFPVLWRDAGACGCCDVVCT